MQALYPELLATFERARALAISTARRKTLQPLIDYIETKVRQGEAANLNFICTHNSRRSQFSQIWARTAADFFKVDVRCFSGGVEVTAFNERAVASVKRSGFKVSAKGAENPIYTVYHSDKAAPTQAFSKRFDDPANQANEFAAIMTCAHADENCPYIPNAEARLAVRYEDPKAFDNTPLEAEKYDERSMQIASEMLFVFSSITRKAN